MKVDILHSEIKYMKDTISYYSEGKYNHSCSVLTRKKGPTSYN